MPLESSASLGAVLSRYSRWSTTLREWITTSGTEYIPLGDFLEGLGCWLDRAKRQSSVVGNSSSKGS